MEIDVQKESNLNAIIYDVLQGDSNVMSSLDVYSQVDLEKIERAVSFILDNEALTDKDKIDLLSNTWRVNYKTKPPTPEEFLTEKYLGSMAESIYPRIRKWFLDFWKPEYRHAVLFPFIGAGKSTLAVLYNLYSTVHVALMRNPKKYFNLSASSVISYVLCSYNLTKAQEILLEPFINILENSEYFCRVRTKEDMIKKEAQFQREKEIDHLYWTTASRNGVSALQFSNNINYKLASSPSAILGLAQPLDEPIKKSDGSYVKMGDLKIGDKIASPSENETTVVGIYPQGKIPCYKITLEDGRTTRCSLQHLWKVGYKKEDNGRLITDVVNLKFIMDHPDWEFFIYDEADCTVPETPNETFVR